VGDGARVRARERERERELRVRARVGVTPGEGEGVVGEGAMGGVMRWAQEGAWGRERRHMGTATWHRARGGCVCVWVGAQMQGDAKGPKSVEKRREKPWMNIPDQLGAMLHMADMCSASAEGNMNKKKKNLQGFPVKIVRRYCTIRPRTRQTGQCAVGIFKGAYIIPCRFHFL
jgi:hypothetical protein